MPYWLLKSEPSVYSWEQMVTDRRTHWNGVRNHQAAGFLRAMAAGDHAFFYHSNEGKEIVGILTIARPAYPDPSDETGRFVMVDVTADRALAHPVSLAFIKQDPVLKNMALVRQSRLSVMPVTDQEWRRVCAQGGVA